MTAQFTQQQQVQETQYSIPYHYIPSLDDNGFSQTLFWSWGMQYLAGLELVISELKQLQFSSLLDVGCGDGRFLKEVVATFPDKEVLGIDYSQTAIALAKALNPTINYQCINITSGHLDGNFEVATMVEVLEHIPIDQVPDFLVGVSRQLTKNGKLILTVPHVNKRLQNKHYQHFSSSNLKETLSSQFEVEKIMPFDRISRPVGWLLKLLGYKSNHYLITNKTINNAIYKQVLRNCLEAQPEKMCGRLLAIAKVKS
ncbi:Methyltransferase type 12 [Halothece sp. PCC 7418]|uniref:class I SAM-dependent methyltransferase n=1 Tax=Halothece sp. (strain PCC 7418) TaxID=65093 RepID=UPI0002A06FC3|nr:class I SAM-dependent methyltransferase [Halothece sp. PCC 7418]AFZ45123.1 Methyltransferase type 12 [Halothece sp. PCC 7418]